MTRKFIICLLATISLCAERAWSQALAGKVVRITPTSLPSLCNTGDLRVDTVTNLLNICATNAWTPVSPGILGANIHLSNLSATAVNDNILPDSDAFWDLGSSSLRFGNVHAGGILWTELIQPEFTGNGLIQIASQPDSGGVNRDIKLLTAQSGTGTGYITFSDASIGTPGQAFISVDAFGRGKWGVPATASASGTASTSGTAAFASVSGTASTSGTAAFAATSGTASFATSSSTASTSGTAAFATSFTGAVTIAQLPTPIRIGSGSVSTPSYSFTAETNTGMYWIGANNFGLALSGTEALDFKKSSGSFVNVGLGTAASTSDSYPLIAQRSVASNGVDIAVNNTNTASNSKACFQAQASNGNNLADMCAYATGTVEAINGSMYVRPNGSTLFLALGGGDLTTGYVRVYTGGDATSAGRTVTFNADHSTTFNGTVSSTSGFVGPLIGTASAATAFTVTPSACGANVFANAIGPNGNLTCATVTTASQAGTAAFASSFSGLVGVGQGGTGGTSWTTNAIILGGNGTAAFSSVGTGSSNQYLKMSSGAPVWASFTSHQDFTYASGSGAIYTPSATLKAAWVRCVGGGGGGGGCTAAASNSCGGGGGGAGGYVEKFFLPAGNCTYSIGAGGGGGPAGNNNGTAGVATTFNCPSSVNMTASGGGLGNGGNTSGGAQIEAGGGGGGAAAGGDLNVQGGGGGTSFALSGTHIVSGAGGTNPLSGGAYQQTNANANGSAGQSYGGGGGGGIRSNSTGTSAGGAGATGECIIVEFFNGN